MPPAIKVENLSKSYLVGHNSSQGEKYTALRDVVSRNVRNLARKTRDMLTGRQIVQGDEVEEFWALKDISFEIQQGDRVGIIGRNGAGKSTLLKILSRITEPTRGRVTIHGRVASLLEVGTGFHPELTGRENIFLNGAILGMSRKEIQRKFDEIVDFAEVEKFLDTPVKRYSSGMYVRLAFAVAAHLEPEILVVDEVLAVGDAQFQKKCLGKMEEVGREGRTVLFVTHNMAAMQILCSRGIHLKAGHLSQDTLASEAIQSYLDEHKFCKPKFSADDYKTDNARILSIDVKDISGSVSDIIDSSEVFYVEIEYAVKQWDVGSYLCIDLFNSMGQRILWTCDIDTVDKLSDKRDPGLYKAKAKIPGGLLLSGKYYLSVTIYNPRQCHISDLIDKEISFEVVDKSTLASILGISTGAVVNVPVEWATKEYACKVQY